MKTILFSLWACLLVLSAQSQADSSPENTIEQEVLRRVNAHRASLGKPALQNDAVLYEQAHAHARNMAEGKTAFGHDGFEHRVRMVSRRRTIKSMAENVAYLENSIPHLANEAVASWLASPGHRENIEGDFTHTAIAVYRLHGYTYFVQLFASYY
ncbi:uncharacterized protein YkwD [Thermonema lapsum]|uniref:Uncharacterized protein YkwD n=1 Tax=Thermonema lapsum TaxID=28195 RepID=A0A846MQ91_9BACT|nr:CAP domain-containing protein [Thermonema lapsum]NIK73629.1 uncharacterized protein YkwD [Thermonema lapsum]